MKNQSTRNYTGRDSKRDPHNRRREAERKAARRAKYTLNGRTR